MRRDQDHRRSGWLFVTTAVGVACAGLCWPCGAVAEDAAAKPPDTPAAPAGPPPAPAYWQAQALPQAVIQGGAIPPGWQPQAIPYQGIGPDGQPLTMYFEPTYVFTYQSGPPVPAMPQVNRRGWWGGQPSPTMTAPGASGWNYATTGAPPVTTTLPPGGVSQYRSVYRFPGDARALQGTELVPPGPLPTRPDGETEAWAGPPPAGPPPQPPLPPPPTQWVPAEPQAAAMPQPQAVASPPAAPAPAQPAAPPPPPPVAIQPLAPPPATPASTHLWRVVGVYDGDTVTCLDENGLQQKVHLAGVDAPEGSAPYGRTSREALANLVFGRVVEVADQGRDGSGTWIARLSVDGNDVGRQMVATGNAACDAAATDPALAAAQAAAQAQQLGIWAQANTQQQ
ncbi:MAG: thermonuclease family protein [Planctomycetota bacterium]